MKLQIKTKYRDLLPALSEEEFKNLENNCKSKGINDSLVITEDKIIIDGHNRYSIAKKHNLTFNVRVEKISDNEIIDWIIKNQLGRRNLSKEQRDYLIGLRYKNEKDKNSFKGNQYSEVDANFAPTKTSSKIAEQENVSPRTVINNELFTNALDLIGGQAKKEILQGHSGIKKGEVIEIAEMISDNEIIIPKDNPLSFLKDKIKEVKIINVSKKRDKKAIYLELLLNEIKEMKSVEDIINHFKFKIKYYDSKQ